MKSLMMFTLLSLASVSVFAGNPPAKRATLIVTATQGVQYKSPYISVGFSDSSFDYDDKAGTSPRNKSMCYVGDVKDVCGIIKAYEKQMNEQYRQGAHDSIDVQSCKQTASDTVEAAYTLSDDYGDNLKVERTLKPCGQ
ncbi:MAG: hypothetical protein ACXWPX_06120 [Pseudobdellovibrio sp.]